MFSLLNYITQLCQKQYLRLINRTFDINIISHVLSLYVILMKKFEINMNEKKILFKNFL